MPEWVERHRCVVYGWKSGMTGFRLCRAPRNHILDNSERSGEVAERLMALVLKTRVIDLNKCCQINGF